MSHPGLVTQPWKPGALAGIGKRDSVLIVGTGLTMADVVASLERAGHKGKITAVSRRGLLPRTHGLFHDGVRVFDGNALPQSGVELLRLVRRSIQIHTGATDWQSVVDAVRVDLPDIWRSLPPKERLRVVRRLLPCWEVHRFRISPQTHEAVVRSFEEKRLTIEPAAVLSLDVENETLAAFLSNAQGARRGFDSIILCAGPSKEFAAQPLLANLVNEGLAQIDEVGLGVKVDRLSQVLDSQGLPQADLLALGPITRGSFGEMIGVPDIIRQIERVAPQWQRASA